MSTTDHWLPYYKRARAAGRSAEPTTLYGIYRHLAKVYEVTCCIWTGNTNFIIYSLAFDLSIIKILIKQASDKNSLLLDNLNSMRKFRIQQKWKETEKERDREEKMKEKRGGREGKKSNWDPKYVTSLPRESKRQFNEKRDSEDYLHVWRIFYFLNISHHEIYRRNSEIGFKKKSQKMSFYYLLLLSFVFHLTDRKQKNNQSL